VSTHGPGRVVSVSIPPNSNSRSRARILATEESGSAKLHNRSRKQAFGEGIVTMPSPTASVEHLVYFNSHSCSNGFLSSNHHCSSITRTHLDAYGVRCSGCRKGRSTSPTLTSGLPLCDWNLEHEGGRPTILSRQQHVLILMT